METRDQLILKWQDAKAKLDAAVEEELRLRNACFTANFPTLTPGTDTHTLELGKGYILKAKTGTRYTLANAIKDGKPTDKAYDAIAKIGNEGALLADRLFNYKPELSVSEYKKLDLTNPTHKKIKAIVDGVLTTKPAQVTLEFIDPTK